MFTQNRNRVIVISIFLLALVVRLLFILTLGIEERIYDSLSDQYIYIDLAKSVVAGRGLATSFDVFVADAYTRTSIQPPVYSLILSVLFYFFGESYLSVRLVQTTLGACMCVIIYLIARKTLGWSVGLLAALIVCVYPPLIMYTRPIMTEILYTFFLSLLVLLLVQSTLEMFRPIHFGVFGALFGLTFLVRPEVLMFAPLFIAFVLCWSLVHKRHIPRSIFAGILLAILVFFILVGPWMFRNWQIHGEPLLFPNKSWGMWEQNWLRYMRETSSDWEEQCKGQDPLVCAVPNFRDLSELERDRYAASLAKEFIFSHPTIFARYGVSRVLCSYPIIPREGLPPPVGYKGVRERPIDGYHHTSLDDFPLYFTGVEKVRVWSFRCILVWAILGLIIGMKGRRWDVMLLGLLICVNMGTGFLLHGKERIRLPIDPYMIILTAYSFMNVVDRLRRIIVTRRLT